MNVDVRTIGQPAEIIGGGVDGRNNIINTQRSACWRDRWCVAAINFEIGAGCEAFDAHFFARSEIGKGQVDDGVGFNRIGAVLSFGIGSTGLNDVASVEIVGIKTGAAVFKEIHGRVHAGFQHIHHFTDFHH